ncbi:MAG: TRAP transporter large permease [Hyphomicrobiaceae bacterium]|nr:TRAP transporter large permease [Hyphomicrobiaceae bacterium]
MSNTAIALTGFAAMLGLIALRMPIGLSMLVVGSVGYIAVHPAGSVAFLAYMKTNPYHQFANYTLSVIPLFILMGALAERAGISTALFRASAVFVGHLRGGLAMAVIGACTAFGAICGSSVATTATFGRAALPELNKFKYDGGFSTGTIAVGGTLGILIPPSVILVVYAISTEQNIAKLFAAALIPGLLAAAFYCIAIALTVKRFPHLAPMADPAMLPRRIKGMRWRILPFVLAFVALFFAGHYNLVSDAHATMVAVGILALGLGLLYWSDPATWGEVLPAVAIAIIVVGGIYGGIFTPTEAAAVGTLAMLAAGMLQRRIGWSDFTGSLKQTAETAGMIFMILLGAEIFGAFLALSQLPSTAAAWVAGLGYPPYLIMVSLMAFYILLGAVMDELAMLLLTLPVFFPIVQALDFGMSPDDVAIWFGILVLIVVGIGLTCPPIGLNVFVISSIARNVPIMDTYRGVLPFLVMDVIRLGLVIAFPALALWLVRLMN